MLSNNKINTLAGIVQATLVTIVGYPFDLVKTKLQAKMYPNTGKAVVETFKQVGVRGFYKGASMTWVSHLLKRPLQFVMTEKIKTANKTLNVPYVNNFTTGAVTGLTGTIFGTPLQCIKVNMQTNNYKNIPEYVKHNFRLNGIKGFYKGVLPTAAKDSMFGMMFMGTYYTLRDKFGADKWWKNFASGATAHCLSWVVFLPIDFIKTTIQRSEAKLTISDVIRTNYFSGGIRVFWKGLLPACVRTIPVSGIGMTGYEFIRSFRQPEEE